MRFKRHLHPEQGLKELYIVPLVNLLFLLVLFFMLTPSLATLPGVKVNLPKTLTGEAVQYKNIEILISSQNTVYLNAQPVTDSQLKAFLGQIPAKNTSILIKADKKTPLERIAQIWDLCRTQGISQINIATSR
jgi:biopolymer transport protein ExbD